MSCLSSIRAAAWRGGPIALAKDAAKGFIQQLAPQDRVAVIGFSDQVAVLQDYTTDRAAASTVIDGLVAQGNTALYQATAGAAVKAASSSSSRRAIILLSDGANEGSASTTTRQDALDAVTKVGVPVFAVGEGTDIDRDYLQQVADGSHGRYLEAPDPKQLGDLYAGIARLLRSQYVITFDASSVKAAGDVPVAITIAVRHADGERPDVVPRRRAGRAAGDVDRHPRRRVAHGAGDRHGRDRGGADRIARDIPGRRTDRRSVQLPAVHLRLRPTRLRRWLTSALRHSGIARRPGRRQRQLLVRRGRRGSGGANPMLFVGAGAALLALLAVALAFVLRARRRKATPPAVAQIAAFRKRTPASEMPPEEMAPPPTLVEVVEEVKGILVSRAGSDLGSEYVVGGQPVSIGSGEHCAVRIADRGLSAVEARIWVRNGQLMLHRMTSLNALANEGVTGGWSILDPGDTFELGPHAFEFRLVKESVPDVEAGDIPNILRDPDNTPKRAPIGGMTTAEPSRLRLVELMPKNDIDVAAESEEQTG